MIGRSLRVGGLDDIHDVVNRRRIGRVRGDWIARARARVKQLAVAVRRVLADGPGVPVQLLRFEGFDERYGSGGLAPIQPVQYRQLPFGQPAHGGRIAAGRNEAQHPADAGRHIQDAYGIGVRAGHVEPAGFGIEGQRARRHPGRLIGSERDGDHFGGAQFLAGGHTHGVDRVRVGCGDKDPGGIGDLLALHLRLRFSGGPNHIRGVRPQPRPAQNVPVPGLLVIHAPFRPTGDEERLAVGMEKDAVGTAARLEAFNHAPRLGIDHGNRALIEVGGIDQSPIRGKRHVAHEIAAGALGRLNHGEAAGRLQLPILEGKLEHRGLCAASRVYPVALGTEGQTEEGVRQGDAAGLRAGSGLQHRDRRRSASVEDQQIPAVRRHGAGHGERAGGNLLARRIEPPAGVQEETAAGQRPRLLTSRGLREQQGRARQRGERTEYLHSKNLWAMGNRRPIPKALVVTFRPGAACWRLYSFRSTLFTMFRTSSIGRLFSAAISPGVRDSST